MERFISRDKNRHFGNLIRRARFSVENVPFMGFLFNVAYFLFLVVAIKQHELL